MFPFLFPFNLNLLLFMIVYNLLDGPWAIILEMAMIL